MSDKYEMKYLAQVGEKYFSRTRIDADALSKERGSVLQSISNGVDHRLTEYIFKALREHGEIVVRLDKDAEITSENPLMSTVTTSIKVVPRKDYEQWLFENIDGGV